MEIGYIIAIVFAVIWFVFKIIEVTKERNRKEKAEKSDNDAR